MSIENRVGVVLIAILWFFFAAGTLVGVHLGYKHGQIDASKGYYEWHLHDPSGDARTWEQDKSHRTAH